MACLQHTLLKEGGGACKPYIYFCCGLGNVVTKMSAYTQNSGARTHSCKVWVYCCSSSGMVTGKCWKSVLTCSVSLTFWFEIHFTECYEYTRQS